ncbi:PLC-like phosphodiesterase [Hypoxylon rubiginosum]|uniref:PLC-like phosphodiesterase n=1 Tax=Hypoxylon rubiginosum TaxID=110542 RepID=A0ACB9ZCB9_9PEZI|nr:PLC-like phosphodiesterase [Hypoxylon rubiginosum]
MRGLLARVLAGCIAVAIGVARADLGDFALQKVLQASTEIFGDTAVDTTTTTTTSASAAKPYADWMSAIPDSTPLARLNIPGAHDAATWNYTSATQASLSYATRCDGVTPQPPQTYRTQRRGIGDALDAGVRFFDLRFALDPIDGGLAFWHGAALLSGRSAVDDVLFAFYAWLARHPREVVLLSFQYEGGTKEGAGFSGRAQELLVSALTEGAAGEYVRRDGGGRLGTLGESRGKVVLLRRFDLDEGRYGGLVLPGLHLSPGRWPDNEEEGFALVYNDTTNATAFIEDYYEPADLGVNSTVAGNVAAKLDAVRMHLEKAAAAAAAVNITTNDADGEEEEEEEDSLFITFASGEHNTNNPPVFPETMALGNGTEATPDGGVNQQLAAVLRDMQGSRLGIVVLDFFDEPEDLVGLVIGS